MMTVLFKKSICFFLLFSACLLSAEIGAAAALEVFVSIPPQAFLAERLGGSSTTVTALADKGQDPHTFTPSPRQISALGKADIYFTIGIPFEKWIVEKIRARNANIRIIDSIAGIHKRKMEDHDNHEGHDNNHAGEPDPHVWLSPPLLKIIAGNMVEALIAADPGQEDFYRSNYQTLMADLDQLHRRVGEQLAPCRGETVFVYHPAFGYLTDTYGLVQESVEIAGKSPTARELAGLISRAQQEKVRIIFVQPQFDRKAALAVAAAIDGAVVPLDSLARNLLQSIEHMAAEIEISCRR
jgi:zinc transport system substrate-binding protein